MGNIGVHLILFSLLLHFQPALIGILCLFSLRSDALLQCEEPLPAVCKWPPAGSGQEAALGAGEWGPGGACPVSGELGWPHAALTLPCVWLRQGSPAPRTAPETEYRSQETAKGRKEWMKSTHLLLGKNRHYSEGGNLWGCRVREKNVKICHSWLFDFLQVTHLPRTRIVRIFISWSIPLKKCDKFEFCCFFSLW